MDPRVVRALSTRARSAQHFTASDARDYFGIEMTFDFFDAFVQRGFGIAIQYVYRDLGKDRSVIDFEGHDVHGASRHLDAVRERIAHTVPAFERRQQRGMGIDHPPGVGVVNRFFEDGAEARHRDEIKVVGRKRRHDLLRVRIAIEFATELRSLDDLNWDSVGARDRDGSTFAVNENRDDREIASFQHCRQNGAAA